MRFTTSFAYIIRCSTPCSRWRTKSLVTDVQRPSACIYAVSKNSLHASDSPLERTPSPRLWTLQSETSRRNGEMNFVASSNMINVPATTGPSLLSWRCRRSQPHLWNMQMKLVAILPDHTPLTQHLGPRRLQSNVALRPVPIHLVGIPHSFRKRTSTSTSRPFVGGLQPFR